MRAVLFTALSCCAALQAQEKWRPISDAGAASARSDETAVWTGKEVVVWGGLDAEDEYLGEGAAYDPESDSWRAMATEGAPSKRAWHTAVWSGREVLVWGGVGDGEECVDSAAWNPATDGWRAITTAGAPTARGSHLAVWTGSRMLIWAGVDDEHSFPKGGLYDPERDVWESFEIDVDRLVPRTLPGIWTGRALLAWGGINGGSVLGHGIHFEPARSRARLLSEEGAPGGRVDHAAVWTGRELVVWGGSRHLYRGQALGDGGRYDPVTDRWRPMTEEGAPPARYGHGFVWNGEELVVLGGATQREGDALADVWAWKPGVGWRRLADLPEPRANARAFATRFGLLVIGGRDGRSPRVGGFICPALRLRRPR